MPMLKNYQFVLNY